MRNDRLIEITDCTVYLLVKCTKTRLTTVMTRVRMRNERLIEMSDCTVYSIPASKVYKDQADHSHDQGEDEEGQAH